MVKNWGFSFIFLLAGCQWISFENRDDLSIEPRSNQSLESKPSGIEGSEIKKPIISGFIPNSPSPTPVPDPVKAKPILVPQPVPNPGTNSPPQTNAGFKFWKTTIQPMIANRCTTCHLGERFAYASLSYTGRSFNDSQTLGNYEKFIDLISLDHPQKSRLLAKPLHDGHPDGIYHAGGKRVTINDAVYKTLLQWIELERTIRCPDCGIYAPKAFIAYVQQPEVFWAIDKKPIRGDYGERKGAKIFFQRVDPLTLRPIGSPIDFLSETNFCRNEDCDFGYLAPNHAGTQLAFECRVPIQGEAWINRAWNICIAGIKANGHAISPRTLFSMQSGRKEPKPLFGRTFARTSPVGLLNSLGKPIKSIWDDHFWIRQRNDLQPVFSPDDRWIYFVSQRPDPRTGDDAVETYHGEHHLTNILASDLDGRNLRMIYKNEGGQADSPFFLKNGNIVVHTWNLERMDRHMYIQGSPDGNFEMPVFFGAVQGPNMWGRATSLSNGTAVTMTGARRGAHEQYAPVLVDHTLGTGLEHDVPSMKYLIPGLFEEIAPYPNGFCQDNGKNCSLSKMILDPSWSPHGALVSYNPENTYIAFGEGSSVFLRYSPAQDSNKRWLSTSERLERVAPFVPKQMGAALLDQNGNLQILFSNTPGTLVRYPVWVGKRQAPRILSSKTQEQDSTATLHIADFKIWLSFGFHHDGKNKQSLMKELDRIKSVRVLYKEMQSNACIRDTGFYWKTVLSGNTGDHPTALGLADSTGYVQLALPTELGGDSSGDVTLKSDASVKLTVPAGKVLLFQGIDEEGHVVAQRSRLTALPPGHHSIQTSVKRSQYHAQCSSCHGAIDYQPFVGLKEMGNLRSPFDFNTEAAKTPPVVLSDQRVQKRKLTYLHALRPIIEKKCLSCHSGQAPAGQLSLETHYSSSANFPAGYWQDPDGTSQDIMNSVPHGKKVPGFDFSITYKYLFQADAEEYKRYPDFSSKVQSDAPLADLMPWEPGYQNLFRKKLSDDRSYSYWYFLSDNAPFNAFGRSSTLGGNSSSSYLMEVLLGKEKAPRRNFRGMDHSQILTEEEKRLFMGVIDVGFPYMSRCNDKTVPVGPNAGQPWGDTDHRVLLSH